MTKNQQEHDNNLEEFIEYTKKTYIVDILKLMVAIVAIISICVAFCYYEYCQKQKVLFYIQNDFHQEIIDNNVIWVKNK